MKTRPAQIIAVVLSILAVTRPGHGQSTMPAQQVIEITGNWRETPAFLSCIQTHEPLVADDRRKTFFQTLQLPPGRYSLRFLYEPDDDLKTGRALVGAAVHCDGRVHPLAFAGGKASAAFAVTAEHPAVELQLDWGHSRPVRTWLESPTPLAATSSAWRAIPPPGGKGELLLAHGIPFLLRKLDLSWVGSGFTGDHPWKNNDRGTLQPWKNGLALPCYDAPVKTAYFLGMIHNIDSGVSMSRKYPLLVGVVANNLSVKRWAGSDGLFHEAVEQQAT